MRKAIRFVALLFSLVIIVIVLLGAIAPSQLLVERSITINAPQEIVSTHMFHFNNFIKWNPWTSQNKRIQAQVIGQDGKVGSILAWQGGGNNIGAGELETTFISEQEMEYRLTLTEPIEQKGDGFMRVMAAPDGKTTAVWGLSIAAPFPVNGLLFITGLSRRLDQDFDRGLQQLKQNCEQPTTRSTGQ